MPTTLTDQQRADLQGLNRLNSIALERGNLAGPAAGPDNLYVAACWSWALTGAYTSVANQNSANNIYDSVFTWGNNRSNPPTAVNAADGSLLHTLALADPNIPALVDVLNTNLAAASGGNAQAQQLCRIALMKITAIANGFTLVDNTADANTLAVAGNDVADPNLGTYAMHMKSPSWYGWDHWGISVLLPNGTRSYMQKINDEQLSRNCDGLWEANVPQTSIALTALLATQVAVITS